MSRRQYVTAERLRGLRRSLTSEAWAVLGDVRTMRVAAALDLQTLHGLRGELRVRPFRRLLKGMADNGVLARLDGRTVGGRRAGSSGYVYVVGPAGQRLLAAEESLPVRRIWTPRPSWLAHALQVSHLYVMVREWESRYPVVCTAFVAEPGCWRPFPSVSGCAVLKPDAFIEVRHGEYVDSNFIEVDCGTESTATLRGKLDAYRRYWLGGIEQGRHGVFPRVVWLAPTAKRLDVLADVISQQPDGVSALHRVALYSDALGALTEEPP